MPKLSGVDMWIEMEGVKLPEYQTQTNGESEVSCWIPCETGKDIRIGCSLPRECVQSQHHQFDFYFDGRYAYMSPNFVRKEPLTRRDVVRHFGEEQYEDGGVLRTFQLQFGNLELTGSLTVDETDMLMADEIVPPRKRIFFSSSSGHQNDRSAGPSRKRKFHEVDEDEESDGNVEETDKEVQIRNLRAELAALKRQLANFRASKRIKKESTSNLVSGEVIDLTI
ncbi:hypothetical protein MD484_g5218, partial [Candolleomyces efflorescens]